MSTPTRKTKIRLWHVLSLLLFSVYSITASAVDISGVGKAPYSWGVDEDELRAAELDALRKAVEKWISTVHPQHFKNYKNVKADIEASITDYILESSVVNTDEKSDTGMVEVKVRAQLNEPMLMDKLLSVSEGSAGGDYIAIVFVAREHAGTVTETEKEASQSKSQTQTIGKDTQDSNASMTKAKTETTGVKTREVTSSETAVWRAFTTNEINTAMGGVFTAAEYLVVDADLLAEETGGLLDVENFVNDYAKGNDIAPSTKSDAVKGLKNLDDPVRYLAVGTLDVDKTAVDEVTGLPSVTVSATGQVLDIQKRGAAVAKVGPEVYSATGKTAFEATQNALKKAGEEVATKIVGLLSSRSIR